MIKGMSLFSSSGIGEYYLKNVGVDIVVAICLVMHYYILIHTI